MSVLKLEYEILISGMYPFEGTLAKQGFTVTKNTINNDLIDSLAKESVIYLSPFLGMCCYTDGTGTVVYLTFRKEEYIEIDYGSRKEYDVAFSNEYIASLNLFDAVEALEKTLVLEVNNDIKFPIKMIKAYDPEGNFVTLLADFMRLNVPCLLSSNPVEALEVMKRQNNRLSSGIAYEKVTELAANNKYFKNALSMYHSSFSLSDHNAGFMLLVIALEALLGLSTYGEPEQCDSCGQTKYKITATISDNVSLILMDADDVVKRRIKKLYGARSKFVHNGKEIEKQAQQEMQEYVRKVLLMYWCVSMYKTTCDHKTIIAEVQSAGYKNNIMYKSFLTGLDNTSFEEKRTKMLKDIFLQVFGRNTN